MAVAALDAYLHRLVYDRTSPSVALPKPLQKLTIVFGDLADVANASLAARRKNPPVADRPWVRVRNVLNDRLLRITFQSSQGVTEALAYVGVSDCWKLIATALGSAAKPESLKSDLDRIVKRRNEIVHEGDFKRLYRPRTLARNPITQAEAQAALDFIEALTNAIDGIV